MAASGVYGAPVFSGIPVWYNTPGYNQHKMNRVYNGPVDDLSGALGGMHMYAANGQPFNKLHAGLASAIQPGAISASFNGSNMWPGAGRYFMPNGPPGIVPQGSHFVPFTNASLGLSNGLVNANLQPGDIPDLARRNSLSSNEEYGPRTPFFPAQSLGNGSKIVVPDNSPQTWPSISPQQLGQTTQGSPQQLWRETNGYVVADLDALCYKAPAIPRPIPAIFSGDKSRGTLETSLENKTHTTNVYIRGLHPDTTDEMLHAYGSRFGIIESAKSMIDQNTSLCKGFGFIKYQSYKDGENCIRGFYHWGYEAKWARDSHNDKLKKLGDEGNTNLYISNLPMDLDFNEHALSCIFENFDCLSAKILRDPNGLSRGVGFARFASPDECRMIIQRFNGTLVGADAQPISIRFADTPDQKRLKLITQERRLYKTQEYNIAAFGPDSPYRHYGPLVAANSPMPQSRSISVNHPWIGPIPATNVGLGSSVPPLAPTNAADASPLASRTQVDIAPFPFPMDDAKFQPVSGTAKVQIKQDNMDTVTLTNRNPNTPVKVKAEFQVESVTKSGQENSVSRGSVHSSPVKATPVKFIKSALQAKTMNTA